MKPETLLGPWPLGIDNVSSVDSLKRDDKGRFIALCDALNVDIDRDGGVARRAQPSLIQPLSGLHSLWAEDGQALGVAQSQLYDMAGPDPIPLATLASDDPCSYAVLNDKVVVGNRTTLLLVAQGTARPLSVPDGVMPAAGASVAGGMAAGKYSLAASFVRGGEEGALSGLRSLTLAEGQGIQLVGIAAPADVDMVRIYRTHAGGAVLYHCADVPVAMASYVIGSDRLGRQANTARLTAMEPGHIVAAWNGRLLVARGRTLQVSEPMSYGLRAASSGFVQFAARVTMVGVVPGGVYVGTRQGVVFLRGRQPKEWTQEPKSALAPVPGAQLTLDGSELSKAMQLDGQKVAVWLTEQGFMVGTEDGQVLAPHADRWRIDGASAGRMVAHSRRITATLQ